MIGSLEVEVLYPDCRLGVLKSAKGAEGRTQWLIRPTCPTNAERLKIRHDPTALLLYADGRVG
jgi:hypothetical protein